MEKRSVGLRGFIYLALVAIAIIASFVYGSLMESNIGSFDEYGPRMPLLPLYAIILIPILITLYFVFLNIASLKLKFTRWKWENTIFILLIIFFTIYMLVLCLTSDISDSINPNFPLKDELPTLDERIWGFFSFYLGLLNIYAFLFLIKPVDGYKTFVTLILLALIMYAVAAIIYSLIVEWDKYVNFKGFEDIYDKPYENYIFSFFAIGNIFGHALFTAIVALVALAFFYRKYWILFFILFFLPFVVYSNCRVALIGCAILILGIVIYLYIRSYKYCRWLFYVLTVILVSAAILLVVDLFIYNFIYIEFGNGKHLSIKELFDSVVNSFKNDRLNIIEKVPVSTSDILLGVGYGIQFFLPRTYGHHYYFHNVVYEVLMAGGVPYLIFLLVILIYIFVKAIIFAKRNRNYHPLGFFLIVFGASVFYGLFESHVPLFNNYIGIVMGFFLVLLPNLFMNEKLKTNFATKESGIIKNGGSIVFDVYYLFDESKATEFKEMANLNDNIINILKKFCRDFSLDATWKIDLCLNKKGDYFQNDYSINNVNVSFDYENKILKISL